MPAFHYRVTSLSDVELDHDYRMRHALTWLSERVLLDEETRGPAGMRGGIGA